ncbi:peptidylprolyl isomerase [Desulfurivibrio alkaliphilus]|uniref:peptidylprolyl isomerase n=1 Tax=Desulfurivibrio alkaliphilus (strain DSM 19089 / UNIQEM U267 / AHT2) TaxID=589865 RepID=D6Z1Q7_DESAT|nr:peptidylprolyl isomerase [Desulfurivibrio alkaliphilus]ADH85482.1 PpiC-type peptidyl-prolyl cis-trans isomerase [Desulfurivibrio alkaliphilus AHT 2]
MRYAKKTAMMFAISMCMISGGAAQAGSASDPGDYVAKINGTTLTMEEVKTEMELRPEAVQGFLQQHGGAAHFVDSLVTKEILYQEALKHDLDQLPRLQELVRDFRKTTLASLLVEKKLSDKIELNDEVLQRYLHENAEEFTVKTAVQVSKIVVETPEKAREVQARLAASDDFAVVAQQFSRHEESAANGGDLGFVGRQALPSDLAHHAFNVLRQGEISAPIVQSGGIYFLKVSDYRGDLPEFDKIRQLLTQQVAPHLRQNAFEQYLAELKEEYQIEINQEALRGLTTSLGQGPAAHPLPADGELP